MKSPTTGTALNNAASLAHHRVYGTRLVQDWVADIASMHQKFGVNPVVRAMDPTKLTAYLSFRLDMLGEELKEARDAFNYGDNEKLVDAIIDLCVFAIGTLDAFDVDAYEAWARVHAANMQKSPGVKPERPNPHGLPDLIKPDGWIAPNHGDNVGLLARVRTTGQVREDEGDGFQGAVS